MDHIVFILGILALVQITFLPGYIGLRFLNIKNTNIIITLVLSFALSLIINYFLVFMLTTVGFYKNYVIYSIFCVELLVFIKIAYPGFNRNFIPYTISFLEIKNFFDNTKNIGRSILYLGSFAIIYGFILVVISNIGQVFNGGDDLVSWNRWAVEWYGNILPNHTWHYPQLLPVNWSLTYVFMNTSSIQFFAKAIMPLFSLYILFLFLDMAIKTRRISFLISLIFTGIIIQNYFGESIIKSGLVDIPVAFFAFIAFYCLIMARNTQDFSLIKKYIMLGSVFCASSALTKQAGLFISIMYPVLTYLLVFKGSPIFSSKEKIKFILLIITVMTVLISPWYIYKQIQITQGLDISEISYVTNGIHEGKNYLERFETGINIICKKLGITKVILIASVSLFGVFNPVSRWALFLIVIPYIAIWGLWFSYDHRNFALAIPFIGLAFGPGLENILRILKEKIRIENLRFNIGIKNYHLVILFTITILILNSIFTKNSLNQRQINLQKQLKNPTLNSTLYNYHKKVGFQGKIMHCYVLDYLPGLEKFSYFSHLQDFDTYKKDLNNKEIKYILANKDSNPKILEHMSKMVKLNHYKLIFGNNDVVFVQIR